MQKFRDGLLAFLAISAAFTLPACAAAAGVSGGPVGIAPYTVNANGPATSANSTPVVQATDQAVSSANTSIPITINTSTTVQLVGLSGSTKIYITAWDALADGAGHFQLVAGTGTNCGTGQHNLTGNYSFVASSGMNKGNGNAAILITAAGEEVCGKTDSTTNIVGSLTYQQR